MALYKGILVKIDKKVAFFDLLDGEQEWELGVYEETKDKLERHIGSPLYFLVDTAGFIGGFCPAYLWTDLWTPKEAIEDTMEDVDTETDKRDDLVDTLHDQNKEGN